ncbi:MAG: PEP-CTERM sorting domain-containing protein [Planctomycetota bacterium]|jgi:hypothetical protein
MKSVAKCIIFLLAFGLLEHPAVAVIVYSDGLVHEISTPVGEDIQVYDGPAGQPTLIRLLAGADTSDVDVFENSRFEMTGGAIGDGELGLHDNSTGHISAGSIADDPSWIGDFSTLTITGIDFLDALKLAGNAQVFIHGANFKLDGAPVGYGPITAPVTQLTGDLLYGQINCGIFFQSDTAVLTLVPEPTTLALLAIGALALRRKRSS